MPHDGHQHHPFGHVHAHAHPHTHTVGHNHAGPDHLHSHPIPADGPDAMDDAARDFIDNFVDGFQRADDKTGFLRLAQVPFEIPSPTGGAELKLVDVTLEHAYQVATASPAFGSAELVYHPYPGRMVRQRTEMRFVYVSLRERLDVPLTDMAGRLRRSGA